MSQPWHSLFWQTTESQTVAGMLRNLLIERGYEAYDPFPGGTGTPPGLRAMVRHFVAPAQDGWVRILGQPDEDLLPELSTAAGVPLLYGWLTGEEGGFALFQGGARHDDPAALEPYLRSDESLDSLRQAARGELPVSVIDSAQPAVVVVGKNDLPPEILQLAQEKGVNPKHADRLVKKLGGRLFGKLAGQSGGSGAEQDQARALVMGGGQDHWNSLNGQRVRAVARVLNLPPNWRVPAWETVRDAYQVHRLRQKSPRMPLMPGDQEAMDAVPEALAYLPVYMGRK